MSRLNALRVSPADDRRNPPRRYCNWLQGLVDKELRRQYERDNITVKSHELANLHAGRVLPRLPTLADHQLSAEDQTRPVRPNAGRATGAGARDGGVGMAIIAALIVGAVIGIIVAVVLVGSAMAYAIARGLGW